MNESDAYILASTFLGEIDPFLSDKGLSFHSADEVEALMHKRLEKIGASLEKPKIKEIIEGLDPMRFDDQYLSLVLDVVGLLREGKRAEAARKKLDIINLHANR